MQIEVKASLVRISTVVGILFIIMSALTGVYMDITGDSRTISFNVDRKVNIYLFIVGAACVIYGAAQRKANQRGS